MNPNHKPAGSPEGGQFTSKAEAGEQNSSLISQKEIETISNNLLEKASSENQKATSDVTSIAKILGGEILGLEHSIKSFESLYRKIYEAINTWGNTKEEAISFCDDIVRFTICFDEIDMAEKTKDFVQYMFSKGYRNKYFVNRYLKSKEGKETIGYKDLNFKFYNPNNFPVEVQIMTKNMYNAKNIPGENGMSGHDVYDLLKKTKDLSEKERLNSLSEKIYSSIKEPEGIKIITRELLKEYESGIS